MSSREHHSGSALNSASTEGVEYRHGDWGPAYLIQGDSSDIGVLRLRPGDSVDNHYHAHCDESFVVVEGEATLWRDCVKVSTLTVGDVDRCVPGEMHYLVNNSDAPFRCIFIKSPASPGDTVIVPWTPGEAVPAAKAD